MCRKNRLIKQDFVRSKGYTPFGGNWVFGMTVTAFDYVLLGLYVLGMVAVAIYTHNRSKSVDDFLLAGKKGLNGWMSAFSYGATYFSAVIFIGYAGNFGAKFGLASIWIGVFNALLGTLLAWKLLARRTKNMTQRLGAKTMPEFFEKRYDSRGIKLFSAIIIFVFLIPYSASVYNGLGSVFKIVLGIEQTWIVMVILAALTALYLFFGGYFATALSDFIQGIIMLIGIIAMIMCFMFNERIGWDLTELVNDPNHTWFTFNSTNKGFYGNTVSLLSLVLLTSVGVFGLPQTVHKYYAIRDKKSINQGMIVSTIFALVIGFGAYFVGSLSGLFEDPSVALAPGDDKVSQMLKLVIPTGLIGIIVILLLSASMSTLSSVCLSSASVVSIDIYKGSINKNAQDKKVNLLMRIFCLIFVAISLTLAILNDKFKITAIAYLMGISWGTLAGCFIGPFVLGLLSKKITKPAVWTSFIGTLIITVVLIIVLGYDVNGWNCTFGVALKSGISLSPTIGVICMAYSLISTALVSLFTKKPSEEVIANAFEKPIENEIL